MSKLLYFKSYLAWNIKQIDMNFEFPKVIAGLSLNNFNKTLSYR